MTIEYEKPNKVFKSEFGFVKYNVKSFLLFNIFIDLECEIQIFI